jgi:HEPN domain-containing protein
MNEFDKLKIGFVMALLGTILAVHPIVHEYRSAGFHMFGVAFTVWRAYVSLAATLALAVYLYAVNVVRERPFSLLQRAGHVTYAVGLSILPAYLLAWLGLELGAGASTILKSPAAQPFIGHLLASLGGAVAAVLAMALFSQLRTREKATVARLLGVEEAGHIVRARQMLGAGHHDLAVIEAYRAVEAALRRAIVESGASPTLSGPRQLIDQALKATLVAADAKPNLEGLRVARNHAVHSTVLVQKEEAERIVSVAADVLAKVRYPSLENEDESQ